LALTANESEYAYRKYTQNFEAYDLYLRARAEAQLLTKDNSLKAMDLSKQVITLDPNSQADMRIYHGFSAGTFDRDGVSLP